MAADTAVWCLPERILLSTLKDKPTWRKQAGAESDASEKGRLQTCTHTYTHA